MICVYRSIWLYDCVNMIDIHLLYLSLYMNRSWFFFLDPDPGIYSYVCVIQYLATRSRGRRCDFAKRALSARRSHCADVTTWWLCLFFSIGVSEFCRSPPQHPPFAPQHFDTKESFPTKFTQINNPHDFPLHYGIMCFPITFCSFS